MRNRISVAMTSFNGGKYIAAQVESLLSQAEPPAEIIVCDDGSTDDTHAILQQYQSQGKLKFFINEERQGVIRNFRKAVSLCQPGNYIALCDQDDVWLPGKLAANADALRAIDDGETPALVYSDVSLVSEDLSVINRSFLRVLKIKPEHESLWSLLFGNFITGCSIMMNQPMASLICQMPVEDVYMHDAWLGMIAFTFGRHRFINTPLVLYRQHGSNVTFETNKGSGLQDKVTDAIRQMTDNKAYLHTEILMAKKFRDTFRDKLSADDKQTLDKFAALEHAFFIRKKLNSIFARRYRFL